VAISNVIKVLEKALDEPEKNNAEIQELEKKLKTENTRKKNLHKDYLDRIFTKDEFLELKAEITSEISQVENRIKELKSKNSLVLEKIERLNMIKNKLEDQFESPEKISDDIISEMVERIDVFSKEKINITLSGSILLENINYKEEAKVVKNKGGKEFQSVSNTI